MRARLVAQGMLVVCLLSGTAAQGAAPDFDSAIAPLLSERCLDCHSGGNPRGGLDLSQRRTAMTGGDEGEVLVPGKPEASRLWEYVADDRMPPKKPLPASEKALLRSWIAAGARWGSDPIDPFRTTTGKRAGYDWWALQPVVRPRVPALRNRHSALNAIDAFLGEKRAAHGLAPSAPADRRALLRRLSFDLLGLPPAPEEVAAFEKDPSPTAYENVVDRYLASPLYGERWARHWLDVVRFGESNGFEFDEPRPNAWPYRDWVVAAFNQDMPYDEFARLQLAGDVLQPDNPAALAATGFLVAGAYDTAGQNQQSAAMKRIVRQDELEDVVGVVGQTFLGLTVHCARCHDHKFDPIRQAEYYRLTAALGGVRHGERPLPVASEETARAREHLTHLERQLAGMEEPIRRQLQAEHRTGPASLPRALARWDFSAGLHEPVASLDARLQGSARLTRAGLAVDGRGYAISLPLRKDLGAKTLEAWVSLDGLQQRGGGVVSVQTTGGGEFDAIVFGEIDAGQWMAGSNNFVRTRSFQGPVERQASQRPVHVAIVWDADGTIRAYRDGKPYGTAYKSVGLQRFRAGQAEVVFGLRHAPPGGNRMLTGVIRQAALYDRALDAEEVAACAGVGPTSESIAAHLPAGLRDRYQRLRAEIRAASARLARPAAQVYAVTPRQPETAHLLRRGNPAQPGEVVAAGGIGALREVSASFDLPADAPEAERRRRLAAWITQPRNPLFARVLVNRLWHYHFGVGLVDTPNDFGFNGGRPSHPELLDWLAAELVQGGWRLKRLHRLMVTSAAYRQASTWNAAAARVDAGNRLLWRCNPRRLEAEAVRDATLQVAGRLRLQQGGPGFQDVRKVQALGTAAVLYLPADVSGPEQRRRTLYRIWSRGGRSRLLETFDCPDPSSTTPSRAVTTTPLQALALLNNAFVLHAAEHFATRLRAEAGGDVDAQVRRAYLLAYGRPPSDSEAELARRAVEKHGLAVLARAIFNSNEFLYVD